MRPTDASGRPSSTSEWSACSRSSSLFTTKRHRPPRRSAEATPLIRYVRVSEQWDPGCDSVTIAGRTAGLRHEDRMGEYAL